MGFIKTEEQQLAVDGLRRYLDDQLEPKLREFGDDIPQEYLLEAYKSLVAFGLIIAPHPEEYGGMGLDWTTHLILFEEVVYSSLDLAMPFVINVVGADLL